MDMNRTMFSSVEEISSRFGARILTYEVCVDFPPEMSSEGIWSNKESSSPLRNALTILQLQIITIFVITQSFHFVFKRFGTPLFFSQFMAGIILGPSIKIEALDKYKRMLFAYGSEDTLSVLASLGYSFFLFVCCVKMDFSMITRTGRKVWAIALSTLLVPIALGFYFFIRFKDFFDKVVGLKDSNSMPVAVISHSGCSFAVIANFLDDLKILNSELGRVALSSALVTDVVYTVVSGTGTAIVNGFNVEGRSAIKNLAFLYSFLILIPLFGRPAMKWVVRNTPEGRPVKKIYTYTILILVLVLGYVANMMYQPFMAGAVVLGLAVPEGPPLGSALVTQVELFASWFLLPLFVSTCTMKFDLSLSHHSLEMVLIVGGTIFLVHLVRSLLCVAISRYCKMPTKDGICLALILCCKGVVEICTITILFDSLKITREMTGVLMLSVLALQCIARFSVQSMYDPSRKYAGYQKRNIMSLKPSSELRLVACIHKPCHITPVRNLLDLCCPTSSQPIVVDVLHLMQLVGRSSPMFISHRLQEKIGSDQYNFSGEVIVSFNLFEHDHSGTAVVNTFTAVSPLSYMHEDVCHMALDKLASIIVLPFHIRWGNDGSVESEDKEIRALNCKVLSRAPCSVGILVNRGFSSSTSSGNQIAMIFIGGQDDREALCLAKRATKDFNFTLVVYHLTSEDNDPSNWDRMLDFELLKDVKGDYNNCNPNVMYEELFIDDASKTTDLVRGIANQFDFILVGRRHGIKSPQTAALVDWTEFSELGAIGDLLASPDTPTKASVLVVQHQQMHK